MPFPAPEQALPEGLLAASAFLSVDALRQAYAQGIFPWYNPGDPVLWWSPDPRMVLPCDALHLSHSLRKTLRRLARDDSRDDAPLQVRVDTDCAQVLRQCAAPRPGREGTWITPDIQAVYLAWHREGKVHSIETWQDGRMVGGLYGVSLGGMFFGESMFSLAPDASKIALAYLVARLRACGVDLIDCQQQTSHLASLGAGPVPRTQFLAMLRQRLERPQPLWHAGRLRQDGALAPLPPPALARAPAPAQ